MAPGTTPEAYPPYDIIHFLCGDKDRTDMSVMVYEKRFDISAVAENMNGSPAIKRLFLNLVNDLLSMNNDDFEFKPGEPDPMEEICHWMAEACFTQFRALAPRPTEPGTINLQEYYNTPTIYLVITVVKGELTAVQSLREPEDLTPRINLPDSILRANIPIFHPSTVKLLWDAKEERPARPSRVFLGDGDIERFFKPSYRGSSREFEREINTLLRLQQLELSDKIRVPKLHGFVSSGNKEDGTEISGILLSYIKFRHRLSYRETVLNAAPSVRAKWCTQLKTMVTEFHRPGIVWGDVKPGNILIDVNDDLWVIDFGGSYTPGWVDEELMETTSGDLQGLSRIIDFINDASFPSAGTPNPQESVS